MSDGLYVFLDFLFSTFYLGEAPDPSEVKSWKITSLGRLLGRTPKLTSDHGKQNDI